MRSWKGETGENVANAEVKLSHSARVTWSALKCEKFILPVVRVLKPFPEVQKLQKARVRGRLAHLTACLLIFVQKSSLDSSYDCNVLCSIG